MEQQPLLEEVDVENLFERWSGLNANLQNRADQMNIFRRLWGKLVELLGKLVHFTRIMWAQQQGGDQQQQGGHQQPDEIQLRERLYYEGIVPVKRGFRIKIDGPEDLEPIANLMKEKFELEKYLETIFKSGRDSRKDLIITIAGTFFLGILNAIVEGLLADHIPFGMRMIVLGIFCATFVVFFGAAMYEQNLIYEHALVDARSSHSTMIRSMNVRRNVLIVEKSAPNQEDLSDEAESQRQKLLQEYCEKIVKPLPIRRQRTAAFVLVGCVVVVLVFACVLKAMKAMSASISPAAPAPAPYFG